MWAFVVFVASILAVFAILSSWQEYVDSGSVTNIESETASLEDITFPTITICNINQVQVSVLETIATTQVDKALLLKEYLIGRSHPLDLNETSKLDELMKNESDSFVELVGQKCHDLIVFIEWKSTHQGFLYDSYFIRLFYVKHFFLSGILYDMYKKYFNE